MNRGSGLGENGDMSRPRALSGILFLLALGETGCVPLRFSRSVLPPGLDGPRPPIREEHRTEVDAERVRLTKEYLELHNPGLLATLPAGDGPEAIAFTPRLVVIHFTAIPTLEETLETLAPPTIDPSRELVARHGRLNVGIQFVVDRDGTVYALYPETVMARHVIGLNHVAIGIENVGDGGLWSRRAQAPLTPAQLDANIALVRYLADRYPTLEYVIGHHEYRDVERPRHPAQALFHEEVPAYRTDKSDPGRRFVKRLRRALREGPR